jgi:membrane protease YdiL (CAAX protease family)
MELHWSDHLLFLIIGIIIPLRTVLGTQPQLKNMRFDTRMKLQLYWGNNLYLWLLCSAVLGIWWLNGRPAHLLGLNWPWIWPQGWSMIVMAVFGVLYVWDTVTEINSREQREMTAETMRSELGFLPQTGKEYFHFIFLALTAGICEEIIFRGYFIRYFQCLLGSEETYTLAILLPAVIFGVVHIYQGWHAVVKIGAMAIMFGYVFVHTDSLWLLILVHALVDLIGGFLAWRLMVAKSRQV